MPWWDDIKDEPPIKDFTDRNRVNRGIHKLEELSEVIRYCADLIFQTGRGARRMVSQISDNKTLSTYPKVVDILVEADKIALDSPYKFAECCKTAADSLDRIVSELKSEREEFVNERLPNKLKGLVDDAE